MDVRPERDGDAAAIRRINELAFGRTEEADLIDALRKSGAITLSLVAELEGELGDVRFSDDSLLGLGLAG